MFAEWGIAVLAAIAGAIAAWGAFQLEALGRVRQRKDLMGPWLSLSETGETLPVRDTVNIGVRRGKLYLRNATKAGGFDYEAYCTVEDGTMLTGPWQSVRAGANARGNLLLQIASQGSYMYGVYSGIHSDGRHLLLGWALGRDEVSLQKAVETLKMNSMFSLEDDLAAEQLPEHILLFMISPFSEEFKPLEMAVRRIFEGAPYYFEVQLARDIQVKEELLPNVRALMVQAHGFIAELTNLNPNVMFELGAVMQPNSQRPVFCLRGRDNLRDVPADLKQQLFLTYGMVTEPVEKIENDLRGQLEKDGRIINAGLQSLISRRRKRFLSRTLVDGLSTRLEAGQINALMGNFKLVDDLIRCSAADLGSRCKMPVDVANALMTELNGLG